MLAAFFGPQSLSVQLVQHIDSASLAQILLKALLTDANLYLEERKQVLKSLVTEEIRLERGAAVANAVCEVIVTGHSSPQWKELAAAIYCPEVVRTLFALLGDNLQVAKAAARVLVAFISNSFFRVAACRSQKSAEDVTMTEEDEESEFLVCVLEGCSQVQVCLDSKTDLATNSTFGSLDLVGELRLLAAEIVLSLTRHDLQQITLQLSKVGAFISLTNLFFQYHWNSFLHGYFYQVCTILINSPVLEIRSTLTLDTNLVERIAEYEADLTLSEDFKVRKGQRGFITRISAMLVKAAETHGDVEEVLSRAAAWQTYVDTQLTPILDIENRPGPDSRVQTHQTEEDEDFDVHIDVEKEGDRFKFVYPSDSHSGQQSSGNFEEDIAEGEDLNVGDLDSADLFDLNDQESPFRACLKGNDAREMLVQGEELETVKARNGELPAEEGREFNSRDYWRLPLSDFALPDLD